MANRKPKASYPLQVFKAACLTAACLLPGFWLPDCILDTQPVRVLPHPPVDKRDDNDSGETK